MATRDEEYRAELIEAVRRARARQQVEEKTDQELNAILCSGLGLPPGTTFTDEQLQMIIASGRSRRRSRRLSQGLPAESPLDVVG